MHWFQRSKFVKFIIHSGPVPTFLLISFEAVRRDVFFVHLIDDPVPLRASCQNNILNTCFFNKKYSHLQWSFSFLSYSPMLASVSYIFIITNWSNLFLLMKLKSLFGWTRWSRELLVRTVCFLLDTKKGLVDYNALH